MVTGKKRVLIVDDDRNSRGLFEVYLTAMGFDCVFAAEGDEAAELISRDPFFDLIITDVMMPYMTGFDFTVVLKSHADTKHIPVIATSAFHDWKRARAEHDLVCDGFVPKPVERRKLQEEIARVLGGRHL